MHFNRPKTNELNSDQTNKHKISSLKRKIEEEAKTVSKIINMSKTDDISNR
jgi:K+/H+ antiporter YhaU regulatory subunit KhtT